MNFGLIMMTAVLVFSANPAKAETYYSNCGGAAFKVVEGTGDHPLLNTYSLRGHQVDRKDQEKEIYLSDVGGWFYAACVLAKDGRKVLLFQEFCGGSNCAEDRYGIVDSTSLKILLQPPKANIGNAKIASGILGKKVLHLPSAKIAFCCR